MLETRVSGTRRLLWFVVDVRFLSVRGVTLRLERRCRTYGWGPTTSGWGLFGDLFSRPGPGPCPRTGLVSKSQTRLSWVYEGHGGGTDRHPSSGWSVKDLYLIGIVLDTALTTSTPPSRALSGPFGIDGRRWRRKCLNGGRTTSTTLLVYSCCRSYGPLEKTWVVPNPRKVHCDAHRAGRVV